MWANASRFAGVWNHFANASLEAQVKLQLYATGVAGHMSVPEPSGFWNSKGVAGPSSYSMAVGGLQSEPGSKVTASMMSPLPISG